MLVCFFFQAKANTRLFSINIMLSSSYAVLTKHFLDHEAKKKDSTNVDQVGANANVRLLFRRISFRSFFYLDE